MSRIVDGLETKTYGGFVEAVVERGKILLTVSDGCGEAGTTAVVPLDVGRAKMLMHCIEEVRCTVDFGMGDDHVSMVTTPDCTTLTLQDGTISVEIPQYKESYLHKALCSLIDEIQREA